MTTSTATTPYSTTTTADAATTVLLGRLKTSGLSFFLAPDFGAKCDRPDGGVEPIRSRIIRILVD
jgi:hypothetical protein